MLYLILEQAILLWEMSHQPQHGILCQHGWSVSDNLVALSPQLQFMCFCPPPVHFNWIQFIRGGILVWSSYSQFFHPKTEQLHNQGHFLKMQIYASYTYIYYQNFNMRGQWSKLSPAKRCCPWAADTVGVNKPWASRWTDVDYGLIDYIPDHMAANPPAWGQHIGPAGSAGACLQRGILFASSNSYLHQLTVYQNFPTV